MALSMLVSASSGYSGMAAPRPTRSAVSMDSQTDLEAFAKELNPVIGYWDPLNLARLDFWGQGDDATIGFLRHSEIKHGRVAMAGFVGYLVQANGLKFPWAPFNGITATSPPEQWDALPDVAKYQIILFVGFLEVFSEHSYILEADGEKHYMKGGKPGYFPSLKKNFGVHPVPLDLWMPFGSGKSMSADAKAKSLRAEVNNGRLAMLGIMGFLAEGKVEGSVPALTGLIPSYTGEVMAPFTTSIFPSA